MLQYCYFNCNWCSYVYITFIEVYFVTITAGLSNDRKLCNMELVPSISNCRNHE